jgi:hypothetical protein
MYTNEYQGNKARQSVPPWEKATTKAIDANGVSVYMLDQFAFTAFKKWESADEDEKGTSGLSGLAERTFSSWKTICQWQESNGDVRMNLLQNPPAYGPQVSKSLCRE